MKLAKQGVPVLVALSDLMKFLNKDYCFPSQTTIVKRLRDWYEVDLSRRQLNRILSAMDVGGLIARRRRHRRDRRRGMILKSTLYKITLKGWRLLYLWGCISKELFLKMLNKAKDAFGFGRKPLGAVEPSRGLAALAGMLKGFKSVFL